MDKIPCLGEYALGWDRTIDPLITRREHEPVRHSTPTDSTDSYVAAQQKLMHIKSRFVNKERDWLTDEEFDLKIYHDIFFYITAANSSNNQHREEFIDWHDL